MREWRPSATIDNLRLRAQLLSRIRAFFAARNVMEVETPLLCFTSVTDPHIESIPALLESDQRYYLQTSPEYAMKRLLAAGSGSIYQMTKAFRKDECGRMHNPEFTILEWYKIDFDHHHLMEEMNDFLQWVLETPKAEKISYQGVFKDVLGIDPLTASLDELVSSAKKNAIHFEADIIERDTWLNLLMTHCIEPNLGQDSPCFIYDFPASQAALARISSDNPLVASRFEVYFKGMELANGFHELQDAKEQEKRFEENLLIRRKMGLNTLPIDDCFLRALAHGLPNCAGVALGVDRLMMLATGVDKLKDILSFDITRA